MKSIFRILKYIKGYKKEVSLNILFNFLYVIFSLFSFVTLVPFASIMFGLVEAPSVEPTFSLSKDAIIDYVAYWLVYYRDTQGIFKCLFLLSLCFIVFTLLSNLFRYLGFFFLSPIRNGVVKDLRNDLYHKLTILPVSYFSSQRRGDIISRMTSDIGVVEWTVFTCLQMVVKDPIMMILCVIALVMASWKFVLFTLIILPVPLFFIKRIGSLLNKNSMKGQSKNGYLLSFAEEAISMIKVTKSLNAEKIMSDRFYKQNTSYAKTMTKVVSKTELAAPLTEFFSILILALVVVIGGLMVIDGQMHPTILIAFTVLFTRIISPTKELITAYYNFKKGDAAAQRICEILDAEEVVMEKPNAIKDCKFEQEIRFNNVSFHYEGSDKFSIQNLSFSVKKGQKVAIVGASGAGKSTILYLFPRFTDPESGNITIDGIDIREFNINSLRSIFGIVTQQSILFNDSIRNNIAFGLDAISEENIIKAAKIANADEFIDTLPDKYDSAIGDNGTLLSGGQKQRLCIARAVVRDPKILLMDEATSAMDTENEHKVSLAIKQAMQGRTMVVVAHRLFTIIDSDVILVMNNGAIVERGTHEELLNKKGYYSKLIKLQKI